MNFSQFLSRLNEEIEKNAKLIRRDWRYDFPVVFTDGEQALFVRTDAHIFFNVKRQRIEISISDDSDDPRDIPY